MKINLKKVSIALLPLYLIGGNFDTLPVINSLPLGLPILSIIIPFAYLALVFLMKPEIPRSLFWFLPLFLLLLPSLLWMVQNEYAINKLTNFLVILTISITLSSFLIRSKEDLNLFLKSLTIFGVLLTLSSIPYLLNLNGARLILNEGGSPIWLSRGIGISLIWPLLLYFNKKLNLLLAISIVIPGLLVMFSTGSRGPILALLLAMMFLSFYFNKITFNKILKTFSTGLLAFLLGVIIIRLLPPSILMRFIGSSVADESDSIRQSLRTIAYELFLENPLGIGIGGFNLYGSLPYPHNLIIEAFVEGGLFFGTFLLLLITFSAYTLVRLAKSSSLEFKALLGIFIFGFVNSMVSGDLTSPKELYFVMGVSINFYYLYLKSEKRKMVKSAA